MCPSSDVLSCDVKKVKPEPGEFEDEENFIELIYKKCPHFSEKCPRTRFALFMAFLMSEHQISAFLSLLISDECQGGFFNYNLLTD